MISGLPISGLPISGAPHHAGAAAQADDPPRRNAALAMGLILACWPTGLEHQPKQQRPSAATIPPPVVQAQPAYSRPPEAIRRSWEQPPEPYRYPVRIAPLTLVYGDQPPRLSRQVAQWPEACRLPQRPVQLVPISIVVAEQPAFTRTWLPIVTASWQAAAWPAQRRTGIAPLVVVAQQPAFIRLPAWILRAWEPAYDQPQRASAIAPLIAIVPDNPPPNGLARLLASIRGQWDVEQFRTVRLPSLVTGAVLVPAAEFIAIAGSDPTYHVLDGAANGLAQVSGATSGLTLMDGARNGYLLLPGTSPAYKELDG